MKKPLYNQEERQELKEVDSMFTAFRKLKIAWLLFLKSIFKGFKTKNKVIDEDYDFIVNSCMTCNTKFDFQVKINKGEWLLCKSCQKKNIDNLNFIKEVSQYDKPFSSTNIKLKAKALLKTNEKTFHN